MKWFGILFMAALLVTAPGYGSAQPQKDTAPATQPQSAEVKKEPAEKGKSFTPEERKAYEKKTAEELEATQKKIVDLKIKATTGPAQQKRRLILTANNLQIQKSAAEAKLAALGKASETDWSQQKDDLDKAMENLRKSCETAGISLK